MGSAAQDQIRDIDCGLLRRYSGEDTWVGQCMSCSKPIEKQDGFLPKPSQLLFHLFPAFYRSKLYIQTSVGISRSSIVALRGGGAAPRRTGLKSSCSLSGIPSPLE